MAKKKGLLQRFRRKTEKEEEKIVPRHKIKTDKDMINYINNELDIEKGCKLLYTWNHENYIYKSYGLSEDNDEICDKNMVNDHKLPPHGSSETCEQESSKINLYSNH